MKRILSIALVLAWLLSPGLVQARPAKGFHTGPYLVLEGGAMQADFDRDQVTGRMQGNDFEPAVGFVFGWNIYDAFSTELQGMYTTDKNGGRRIHIASANVYAKLFLITNFTTDFPSFRAIPFVKAGMGFRATVLPSTPTSATPDDTLTRIGVGPSIGAGVAFMWKKYLYFGIDLQEDLYIYDDIDQTVGGVPNTRVYNGGFQPSFTGMAFVGVHY